jgi:hypothetical protein
MVEFPQQVMQHTLNPAGIAQRHCAVTKLQPAQLVDGHSRTAGQLGT